MNIKTAMTLYTFLASANPLFAQSIDCNKYLRMHGFASRAQFQCGFSQYNQNVVNQASVCARTMSEQRSKQIIADGMKLFDEKIEEWGKTNACYDVLRNLSSVVRR